METTPRSLLERLCTPADPHALAADWARLVVVVGPLLYSWARKMTKSPDAEDLVQEVFQQLLLKLPGYRHDGRPRGFRKWLYTMLRHLWIDKIRCSHYQTSDNLDLMPDPIGADPVEAIAEKEYNQYLIACALRLVERDFTPTTWHVFVATEVNGRPVAEVAMEYGMSQAAVYKALSRVRSRLRSELGGMLD